MARINIRPGDNLDLESGEGKFSIDLKDNFKDDLKDDLRNNSKSETFSLLQNYKTVGIIVGILLIICLLAYIFFSYKNRNAGDKQVTPDIQRKVKFADEEGGNLENIKIIPPRQSNKSNGQSNEQSNEQSNVQSNANGKSQVQDSPAVNQPNTNKPDTSQPTINVPSDQQGNINQQMGFTIQTPQSAQASQAVQNATQQANDLVSMMDQQLTSGTASDVIVAPPNSIFE